MEKEKQSARSRDILNTIFETFAKERGIKPDEVEDRLVSAGYRIVEAEKKGGFACIYIPGEGVKKISPFKKDTK
jgi:hypothetical protein